MHRTTSIHPIRCAVVTALSLGAVEASASSHREAPFITTQPKVDATDFYAFRSYEEGRDQTVTLIANYAPLQDAYGGPNYFSLDPSALYEIHVDNDGDSVEDITFQFRFDNQLHPLELDVGGKGVAVPLRHVGPIGAGESGALTSPETYRLYKIDGDRRTGRRAAVRHGGGEVFTKPYDYVGEKTFSLPGGYAAYAEQYIYDVDIPGCAGGGRVFVGQRRESFSVNLGRIFDLVNLVPVEGDSAPGAGDGAGFPFGITQDPANNQIADKNVTSLALELPIACVTGEGSVIGAWTTASLPQARLLNPVASFEAPAKHGGAYVQVSRLGMPLVNEVVIGLPDKNRFNGSEPSGDGQFATYVTNPSLPALLNVLFLDAVNALAGASFTDLAPSNFPRNDLVAAFLTGFSGLNANGSVSEMSRLNTDVPPTPAAAQSSLGVAADDLAGFPNGRRPGDDVVDVALRVVMGRLCHPVILGGAEVQLGLCDPADAPTGLVPFTDGAPISASDFDAVFPYLNTPVAGSKS